MRRFLLAEAQLNFGDAAQTDEETVAALGDFRLESVGDGDEARGRPLPRRRLPRGYAAREYAAREQVLLPKEAYAGSPTPLGVQVFDAPHKRGIPAVAYGVYRVKRRLKQECGAPPLEPWEPRGPFRHASIRGQVRGVAEARAGRAAREGRAHHRGEARGASLLQR